jgi:hypothetical protein
MAKEQHHLRRYGYIKGFRSMSGCRQEHKRTKYELYSIAEHTYTRASGWFLLRACMHSTPQELTHTLSGLMAGQINCPNQRLPPSIHISRPIYQEADSREEERKKMLPPSSKSCAFVTARLDVALLIGCHLCQ